MNYLAALTFQVPTDLTVNKSSFWEIQELRELLCTKCSFREDLSSASSSIFSDTQFCNKAFISQPVTHYNLAVLQLLYCTLLKTKLCNFDKMVHSKVHFMLLTQHG